MDEFLPRELVHLIVSWTRVDIEQAAMHATRPEEWRASLRHYVTLTLRTCPWLSPGQRNVWEMAIRCTLTQCTSRRLPYPRMPRYDMKHKEHPWWLSLRNGYRHFLLGFCGNRITDNRFFLPHQDKFRGGPWTSFVDVMVSEFVKLLPLVRTTAIEHIDSLEMPARVARYQSLYDRVYDVYRPMDTGEIADLLHGGITLVVSYVLCLLPPPYHAPKKGHRPGAIILQGNHANVFTLF